MRGENFPGVSNTQNNEPHGGQKEEKEEQENMFGWKTMCVRYTVELLSKGPSRMGNLLLRQILL